MAGSSREAKKLRMGALSESVSDEDDDEDVVEKPMTGVVNW